MKKIKIPKIFRKQYSEKKLNKKILKKIHIPRDREMVSGLFVKNSQGKMEIKPELPDDVLKKLKPLAKSVKKNKGLFSTWKILVLAVFISAVLIFNFFFLDKLVKKAVETGLESVFQADVLMEKPHLSLLKGEMTYESLTIADEDKPNRNLIETGRGDFQISIAELTRKRVRIDNMSLEGVLWNTKRPTVLAIQADGDSSEVSGDSSAVSGSSEASLVSVDDFDFQGLLDQQKANLKSLQFLDESTRQMEELSSRWSTQIEINKSDINSLSGKVNEIKSVDVKGIDSVVDAQAFIVLIQEASQEVKQVKDNLNTLNNDFISDKKNLVNTRGDLTSLIEDDLSYLNGFTDFSTGNIQSVASSLAEDYLRSRWNTYYEYGLKALNIYKRFGSTDSDKSEKKKGLNRDSGRTVHFFTPDNPDFLMTRAFISGGDAEKGKLSMEIQSVSSDPDKVAEPLTFQVGLKKESTSLQFDGFVDGRTDSSSLLGMNIFSPANPVELNKGIPSLSINHISSIADLTGQSVILKNDDVMTTLFDINLNNLKVQHDDSDSLLSGAVASLFAEDKTIRFTGEVVMGLEGLEALSIDSDFDRLISESVGSYLENLDEKIMSELKKNLIEYITPELENNEVLISSLDSLGIESSDQISSVNVLAQTLDTKKNETEEQVESIVQSESGKIIDSVKKKIKVPGF